MKLINKDALVAEIEKYYNESRKMGQIVVSDYWNGKSDAYRCVLTFLDTLEVKEVDLDFFLHEYWSLSPKISIDCLESVTMSKDEMFSFAKHFFELGLKVQKGE